MQLERSVFELPQNLPQLEIRTDIVLVKCVTLKSERAIFGDLAM